MKRLNTIMLFITLISMISTQTKAHDFEVDGMYYNIVSISDLTCEVTFRGTNYHDGCFTYYGEITVPEYVQYNGKSLKVVGIGDYAFYNYNWHSKEKETVTSISLPNSIEYLGNYALAYNTFSDFKVPSSLKKIGYGAFVYYETEGVKRIYVNDLKTWCEIEFKDSQSSPFCHGERNEGTAITFGLYTAKGELYLNNELCEVITIPNEIKKINNYAFAGVASIKEIVLPKGIKSIGDFAFCNCINLLSIKTPSTCKMIGKHAFNGCSQLSKVELSEGLKNIGEGAFSYCLSLQSLIFPSSIKVIGEYLFYGMDFPHLFVTKSSTPLYCPKESLFNIKTIDFQREFTCRYWWKEYYSGPYGEMVDSPFGGYQDGTSYNKLKTVIIGPNVKHIHKKVFEGCSLDSVVLQNSETSILLGYERADSTYSEWLNHVIRNDYSCTSAFHNIPIKYLHIGRPIEIDDVELHQGATREGADYRLSGFFENSTSFQEITIGNFVSDISFLIFEKYKDLSSVTFGSGLETIPELTLNDKLDSIVVINNNPPRAIGFANTTYLHCKLFVPKGCKAAYESADVWKNFWNIIELDQDINSLGIKHQYTSPETIETVRYAIDGTKVSFPQRGINIIKMSDGTTKKVLVK